MNYSIVLSRKFLSIFMVTYLPTILMNMINQATNYIKMRSTDDKFTMIYTVNITCMMVLASVYLSVSSSLPSTANIKPVEVWLLFNLAYPILVMLSNIFLQVHTLKSILRSPKCEGQELPIAGGILWHAKIP